MATIEQLINDGYISTQRHPTQPLTIYNYTAKAQYDRVWNEHTLQCRGLIKHDDGTVVARPFPKFFNYEEVDPSEIPNEPFDVFAKHDGSLGILYWNDDTPCIATRGSFTSPQAQRATEILHEKYHHLIENLSKDKTFLFEIIYPENRIVVDYDGWVGLILLAVIDTETGCEEQDIGCYGFRVAEKFDGIQDVASLTTVERENFEGYVVRFQSGYRLKVKLEEYKRLHRIVTGVSNKTVWEYLRDGRPFDELVERVPDEFADWLQKTTAEIHADFFSVRSIAERQFRKDFDTRKEAAEHYQKWCMWPQIMFAMLDGKPYDHIIWKLVKPKFESPFKAKSEAVA